MSVQNNVTIIGRVAKDISFVDNGDMKSARTTVAVQRNFKDKDGNYGADFISVFAFGSTAEHLNRFYSKGKPISLRGNIRTGSYTNKDGQKVYTTEVAIDELSFLPGSKSGDADEEPKTETKKTSKKKTVNVEDDDDFMTLSEDEAEDLPF